jgi:hypothetical protein
MPKVPSKSIDKSFDLMIDQMARKIAKRFRKKLVIRLRSELKQVDVDSILDDVSPNPLQEGTEEEEETEATPRLNQKVVLGVLRNHSATRPMNAISAKVIAKALNIDPPNLHYHLTRAEKQGVVGKTQLEGVRGYVFYAI